MAQLGTGWGERSQVSPPLRGPRRVTPLQPGRSGALAATETGECFVPGLQSCFGGGLKPWERGRKGTPTHLEMLPHLRWRQVVNWARLESTDPGLQPPGICSLLPGLS